MRLTHQLEKDVGCKVQFINTTKIMKLLSYKILRYINTTASYRPLETLVVLLMLGMGP